MQKTSSSDHSILFITDCSLFYSQSLLIQAMKKDQESLLRMNFLIQAARIYADSAPEYSQHFLYDFLQLSEKKMIRIDKQLKKKIDKKRFSFNKAKHLASFLPNPSHQPTSLKQQQKMQVEHPQ